MEQFSTELSIGDSELQRARQSEQHNRFSPRSPRPRPQHSSPVRIGSWECSERTIEESRPAPAIDDLQFIDPNIKPVGL